MPTKEKIEDCLIAIWKVLIRIIGTIATIIIVPIMVVGILIIGIGSIIVGSTKKIYQIYFQ